MSIALLINDFWLSERFCAVGFRWVSGAHVRLFPAASPVLAEGCVARGWRGRNPNAEASPGGILLRFGRSERRHPHCWGVGGNSEGPSVWLGVCVEAHVLTRGRTEASARGRLSCREAEVALQRRRPRPAQGRRARHLPLARPPTGSGCSWAEHTAPVDTGDLPASRCRVWASLSVPARSAVLFFEPR